MREHVKDCDICQAWGRHLETLLNPKPADEA